MNEDSGLVKQSMLWSGALLGISTLWVGLLAIVGVVIVSYALPDSRDARGTTTTTPAPNPASSVPQKAPQDGSRPAAPVDEPPSKRRNG